jgi:hypothetical protein
MPVVFGTYNNIIEGERQNAKAVQQDDGQYEVTFWVNSPRSAVLYVDDEAIEIFLVPDSSLQVRAVMNSQKRELDSLEFQGYTAGICQYYREKRNGALGGSTFGPIAPRLTQTAWLVTQRSWTPWPPKSLLTS